MTATFGRLRYRFAPMDFCKDMTVNLKVGLGFLVLGHVPAGFDHRERWTKAGGFAWPKGYNSFSPQLD